MKQVVTFDRVQSVTLEFELEGPMTQQHADFWANYENGGKPHLNQVLGDPTMTGVVRVDAGAWKSTTAQPDFKPTTSYPIAVTWRRAGDRTTTRSYHLAGAARKMFNKLKRDPSVLYGEIKMTEDQTPLDSFERKGD